MPIKNRTKHEKPTPKKTASGLFVKHGETGERPHKGLLDDAMKIGSKHRAVGGKKTLTR